jgi:hypothetical protein
MTQQQPPTADRRKTSPSSKSTERHLVRNVTAENYQEVGSAFIGAYGGAIIALADGELQGVQWTANPRQWGAWRAYLAARKIKIKFMDARGKEGKSWTVPAAWPHEFDSEATVQGDQEAANWFMTNYRPERLDLAAAAKRAATVAAMKAKMPPPHQYQRYEPETGKPELKYNNYDELLANYEKDAAAARGNKA